MSRILHLTPVYAGTRGGIENVVSNLVWRGRQYGHQVDVMQVAPGLARSTVSDGSGLIIKQPLRGNRIIGWTKDIRPIAQNYDILHVHDPQVGALTLSLHTVSDTIPAILSTHGGFWHTRRSAVLKHIHAAITMPYLLRRFSHICASSKTDFNFFSRHSRKVVLAENGVDVDLFRIVGAPERSLARWIYWGRFANNKRLDRLVSLIAHLRAEGIIITLLLCGADFDGSLGLLRRQVIDLDLCEQISFIDAPPTSAIIEMAKSCGVFPLPSEYEGFGISLLEGMAAGLIPVCRNKAPMNELAGEAGLFLTFGDDMRSDIIAIKHFLALPDFGVAKLRQAALQRVARYHWDCKFNVFSEVYTSALNL